MRATPVPRAAVIDLNSVASDRTVGILIHLCFLVVGVLLLLPVVLIAY
jgi:hypothetical protein